MRIISFTAMYGRKATEFWWRGQQRLQRDFDITPFAVISGKEAQSFCEQNEIAYVMAPNSPLGQKHNIGLQEAFKQGDWEVLLHLGDDDVISTKGLQALLDYSEKGFSHLGYKDLCYIDSIGSKCHKFEYDYKCEKLVGAGRLFDRNMLENWAVSTKIKLVTPFNFGGFDLSRALPGSIIEFPVGVAKHMLGYRWFEDIGAPKKVGLWQSEKESGLDGSSELRLVKHGQMPKALKAEKHHIIDLKTESNKWSIAHFQGQQVKLDEIPFEEATWFCGNPEIDFLKTLYDTGEISFL